MFIKQRVMQIGLSLLCGLYSASCMPAAAVKALAQRAVVVPEQQKKRNDAWLSRFPLEVRILIKQYYLDYVSLLPVLYKSLRVKVEMSSETSPFAICSDGKVVSALYDKYHRLPYKVRILNTDGSVHEITNDHNRYIKHIEIGPGDRIIIGSDYESTVGNAGAPRVALSVGPTLAQDPVVVAQDGRITIAAPDYTEQQSVWDKSGHELYKVHHSCVWASAFGNDGTLVTGAKKISDDAAQKRKHALVCVWNADGNLRHSLDGHTDSILSVAVGNDGTIVTGSCDKTARIWNADGSLRKVLVGHVAGIQKVVIKHDKSIVTADQAYVIKVWTADGLLQATLRGHKSHMQCLEASEHGTIISSSYHGMVRMWNDKNQNCATFNGAHRGRVGRDGTVAVHLKNNILEMWRLDPACVKALLKLSFEQLGHIQWLLVCLAKNDTKKFSDLIEMFNDEQRKQWLALPTWVRQKMLQWQWKSE